ncbi:MAG: ABC transporter substrate-binding protein [Thermoplasmatota archaeon]
MKTGKKILTILLVSVLVMSAMALTGCTQEASGETSYLRVGFSWPTEIDPAIGSDYSSSTAFTNLYDPLVYPTQEGVKPWIAEDWEASPDGKEYTFDIKEGVKFHSGNELTAEDVMFSMQRLKTIGEGYAYLFTSVNMNESEKIDDYTVKFVLDEPSGVFLSTLVRLYIVDKEVVMNNLDETADFQYPPNADLGRTYLSTNDAGSGPYEVSEVVPQDHVNMKRFEDYWGEFAEDPADEYHMLALGEPSTERTMFSEGELEITSQWLPYQIIDSIVESEDGKEGAYPSGGLFYGMLNNKKKPLDDVHVRRALAYSFDYETQIEEIFPASKLPKSVVPAVLAGAADIDLPRKDMEKAEEELRKSKYYPDIVENPDDYEIECSWTASVSATEEVALLMAEQAEKIGLQVDSQKYQWSSLIDAMATEETSPHIAMVWVSAHYPEAGSILESRYASDNADSWEQNEWLLNDTIDTLIDDALEEVDQQTRYSLYDQIQKDVVEMCASMFLHTQYSAHAYQSYVTWPQVENVEEDAVPVMGYNIDARRISVTPPNER